MSAPLLPDRLLTLEEYMEFEEASPIRHEFVGGEVYAMSGATRRHGRIVGNIFYRLQTAARGGPCEVQVEAIKLRVGDNIYYPDVVVTCSITDTDGHTIREPCLLVEVTSPATARIDRTEKLAVYRGVPSLQAYLIVEQAWRRVARHWRNDAGIWEQELMSEGTVTFPCPVMSITVDVIYEGLAPLTVQEMEAIGYAMDSDDV